MSKDIAPLLQTLCWPLVVGVIVIWLHDPIGRLIRAIAKRVEDGDSFEAGSSGVKLTSTQPRLATPSETPIEKAVEHRSKHISPVYLLHRARRDQKLDKDDHEYYRLVIWIDSDDPDFLSKVEEVTYYLHSTFKDPIRLVSNSDDGFALKTAAWGQFLLSAAVKMRDGKTTYNIERYLNF